MRCKSVSGLLISLIVACFLSGYVLDLFLHVNPVYLHLQLKSDFSQTLYLFTSKNGQFSRTPDTHVDIKKSTQWQDVRMAIPINRARHLQLGLRNTEETLYFGEIKLNGHPLDLMEAYAYHTRNIRSCNPLENGTVACRVGGNQGFITFSPKQLAVAVPAIPKWLPFLCFALCWVVCLLLYKKYARILFLRLQTGYPTWVISLLFIGLVCVYYAMRWQAFLPRINAVFITVGWTEFLLFAQEQAGVIAVLLGLACLTFRFKNKYLKGIVLACGLVLILLEGLDSALLYLLNARFAPEQIGVFGPDIFYTAGPFIKSYFISRGGVYFWGLVIGWSTLGIYAWKHPLNINLRKVVCVFAAVGFLWYLLPSALSPAEKLQLRDWPRLTLHKVHAPKNKGQSIADFELTYQCKDGLNSQQNIVLVLVESLSSYMSQYFSDGKTENWTPHLDQLARRYTPFTNYRTTNPDTTQALFSILTGFPAIHYYAENNLYREPKFYHRTLPKIFHQAGYHTAFFTSASFVYSKDYILERIGFDEVSNDTDPFYKDKKRFIFHSVSDDVLYERATKWMQDYQQPNPYLLVLETTTSHAPFIDPQSGEESLEKAIRYADKALGNFIADLEQKHLLDNTLLILTSDHRVTKQPLTEQQLRIFGEKAEASIPFIVIGSPLTGKQNTPATHIDLIPSLSYVTLSKACFHPYQHNLFAPKETRTSCTLFQSFAEKNTVAVQCQDQPAKLCLTEDNDFICKGKLPEQTTQNLLSFINWIRDNNRY